MGFLSQPISIIPIRPVRKIDTITVQVIIQENTSDNLTITRQPVQQGASITDHAYKEPTTLSMSIYFNDNSIENLFSLNVFKDPIGTLNNNNGLSKIYQQLLTLQSSRNPINVVTPKRIYKNMLISSLGVTTDKQTEYVLKVDISFQEVIIVNVTTVQVPRASLKNPGSNGATQKAGQKSGLLSGSQAVGFSAPGFSQAVPQ